MKLQKKLIWSALFATTVVALSGCGGGGSSNSASNSGTAGISGVVADGYLGNATVCLDINKNKKCDVGEPSGTSEDGTGAYSLSDATAEQASNSPILVVVTTSTTDSDLLNNSTVPRAYTLSAPAGKYA